MIRATSTTGTTPPVDPQAKAIARLTKTAKQFEGVFVQQLFKAMRDTVPQDGLTSGGAGEDMFTGILDQNLSDKLPQQWKHGPAEAMVAHFRAQVTAQADSSPTPVDFRR
jgi:flagellar protein FlgJ